MDLWEWGAGAQLGDASIRGVGVQLHQGPPWGALGCLEGGAGLPARLLNTEVLMHVRGITTRRSDIAFSPVIEFVQVRSGVLSTMQAALYYSLPCTWALCTSSAGRAARPWCNTVILVPGHSITGSCMLAAHGSWYLDAQPQAAACQLHNDPCPLTLNHRQPYASCAMIGDSYLSSKHLIMLGQRIHNVLGPQLSIHNGALNDMQSADCQSTAWPWMTCSLQVVSPQESPG